MALCSYSPLFAQDTTEVEVTQYSEDIYAVPAQEEIVGEPEVDQVGQDQEETAQPILVRPTFFKPVILRRPVAITTAQEETTDDSQTNTIIQSQYSEDVYVASAQDESIDEPEVDSVSQDQEDQAVLYKPVAIVRRGPVAITAIPAQEEIADDSKTNVITQDQTNEVADDSQMTLVYTSGPVLYTSNVQFAEQEDNQTTDILPEPEWECNDLGCSLLNSEKFIVYETVEAPLLFNEPLVMVEDSDIIQGLDYPQTIQEEEYYPVVMPIFEPIESVAVPIAVPTEPVVVLELPPTCPVYTESEPQLTPTCPGIQDLDGNSIDFRVSVDDNGNKTVAGFNDKGPYYYNNDNSVKEAEDCDFVSKETVRASADFKKSRETIKPTKNISGERVKLSAKAATSIKDQEEFARSPRKASFRRTRGN